MPDETLERAAQAMEAAIAAGMNARLSEGSDCGCYTEDGVATCLMCQTSDFAKRLEAAAPLLTAPLRLEVERLTKELELARGVTRADDERLNAAAIKVWGENVHGCDAAEWLADEVLGLRAEVERLTGELDEARRKLGPIAFGFKDGVYTICLGYHEATDERPGEYEWAEVVLKSRLDAAESEVATLRQRVQEGEAGVRGWHANVLQLTNDLTEERQAKVEVILERNALRAKLAQVEAALEKWGWTPQTCPQGQVGCYLPPGHDHPTGGPFAALAGRTE